MAKLTTFIPASARTVQNLALSNELQVRRYPPSQDENLQCKTTICAPTHVPLHRRARVRVRSRVWQYVRMNASIWCIKMMMHLMLCNLDCLSHLNMTPTGVKEHD
eukprot:5856156-Amphidinium_carterae.1